MFKKRKKDTRTYKNFKYWSIDKLREVLNENYCRGWDGHDYEPYKEEMQQILWDKENRQFEEELKINIDNIL